MKKTILCAIGMLALLAGCAANLYSETSYFDGFSAENTDTTYTVKGTVHQMEDDNATVAYLRASQDAEITVKGTMKQTEGDIQLLYIAPDGTQTLLQENENESVDVTFKVPQGEGCIRFSGENAVYRFELQLEAADPSLVQWSSLAFADETARE